MFQILLEKELSQNIILICMPFISGTIGWFTNFIAVKMLLKPINPVKFMGMTFQGLLPRRHKELAGHIAITISKDFLTEDNIISIIKAADTKELMRKYILKKWDEKIGDILSFMPMIQMFLQGDQLNQIRDKIAEAFSGNGNEFVQILADNLAGNVNLEEVIKNNILAFDLERLEKIIEEIANKEFRYIERLGGIIGFLIGLVQAIFVFFLF